MERKERLAFESFSTPLRCLFFRLAETVFSELDSIKPTTVDKPEGLSLQALSFSLWPYSLIDSRSLGVQDVQSALR